MAPIIFIQSADVAPKKEWSSKNCGTFSSGVKPAPTAPATTDFSTREGVIKSDIWGGIIDI